MFDYILTGPISGVSAGQYVIGLIARRSASAGARSRPQRTIGSWGSVAIAIAITALLLRQNIRGIHESSDKALKIMGATTVMARHHDRLVPATLVVHPEKAHLPTMVARPVARRCARLAEARRRRASRSPTPWANRSTRSASSAGPALGDALAARADPLAQPDRPARHLRSPSATRSWP